MRRLVLIRHAKSSWKDPARADFDRPLTKRGKADAPEMGRRLAARGIRLDAFVTSPARRARSTAAGLAKAVGMSKGEILESESVYHASVSGLLDVIRGFDDSWEVVGLVGHNPGFSDLAEVISDFGSGIMPTCAVMAVDFDVDSWSHVGAEPGRVAFYDYPKNPDASAA